MKHILSLFAALVFCTSAAAQVIPDDPAFRIGKLDNGLTYYLYHNENPENCADFYIAHNVGALQEEDSQNGLAHFLEHMAFNGTKNYPDKGILDFLAKDGVRFGYNVNAYTSRTETVYNISKVPLVRESFVDSVMTVLYDWSCNISCEPKALDEERGVINEEWRLRDDQRYRMMCKQTGLIYKGGKQPERTVLGDMNVINSFTQADILDFYHKWYRPDMQAIIIVGDFDLDEMEAKVRSKYADIPMRAGAPAKPSSYKPAEQTEALFEDMTDHAVKFHAFKIIYKQDMPSRKEHRDELFWADAYSRQIVSYVLSERIRSKAKGKDCPYSSAVLVTSAEDPDYYISLFTISARKEAQMPMAVERIYREISRIRRYGISESEFEMARLSLVSKDKLDASISGTNSTSSQIVKNVYNSFLRNYPCLTPEGERAVKAAIVNSLEYSKVNAYCRTMFDNNRSIWSNCINSAKMDESLPAQQTKEMIAKVDSSDIQPEFLEYAKIDLNVDSAPGKIISENPMGAHGIEQWQLSNGATVYYSKTAPAKSQSRIIVNALFDTGWKAYPQDNIGGGKLGSRYYLRNAGFRGVSRLDFKNYPDIAGIDIYQSSKSTGSSFSLNSDAQKAQVLFKVFNLYLSDPYLGDEAEFGKFKSNTLRSLAQEKSSSQLFDISAQQKIYANHPWCAEADSSAVQAYSFEDLKAQYRREYGDISKAKIFICSDIDREQIRGWVERYIASIRPEDAQIEYSGAPYWQAYSGKQKFSRSAKPVSAPLCQINCMFSYKLGKGPKEHEAVAIMDYIMSARYLAQIREARGGAYHVGYETDFHPENGRKIESCVSFQTRPQLREVLLGDVFNELERMAKYGPDAQEMELAKKYLVKSHGENEKAIADNVLRYHDRVVDYVRYGVEFGYDHESVLDSIDAADIKKLARTVLKGDSLVLVYSEE